MAVVKADSSDIYLLARLLGAEGEGEGQQGRLMIGNVGINRIRAYCSDFKGLRTIPQMVYQPHAFETTIKGYFYQRARESEKRLAHRAIDGERLWPAKYSLWYISVQKEIVLLHGTISPIQDVLNFTVFMNPQVKSAQIFTIHFNLFLYNRLTYNYDKKEY
jgi:N-acetylmuramoyl-L-alanine amidase